MDNWTQWTNVLSQINHIKVANVKDDICDIKRSPGLFQKVFMSWETNTQTLFQFKQIYTHRLKTLKQAFQLNKWKTIEDLNNNQRVGEIIGLFKRIQTKRIRAFEPEYLEKYENNKPIFSENDTYQLEDETGKVKLEIKQSTKINGSSKFNGIEIPYGVIIKCRGEYNPRLNRFVVSNVETPMPAPQRKMMIPFGVPKYMGVLCEPTLNQVMEMRDIIRISLQNQALQLCELVIIGGVNYEDIEEIRKFDAILFELGAMIDTFIVPSSSELNSHIFPQMPLHKSFLPKCYLKSNVTNCSNPQLFSTKERNLHINTLVSCGQNLLNLKANCNIQQDLGLMKMIIEYRHMCPSSVFSLPIQSYNYDPLILEETPHLMIHGKCDMFSTQFYERQNRTGIVQTRLVALAKGDFVQIDLTSNVLQAKKRKIDSFKM